MDLSLFFFGRDPLKRGSDRQRPSFSRPSDKEFKHRRPMVDRTRHGIDFSDRSEEERLRQNISVALTDQDRRRSEAALVPLPDLLTKIKPDRPILFLPPIRHSYSFLLIVRERGYLS
jgi:hypothetical protein